MTRGVRLFLVGSIALVTLAGCGRGFFTAEREPWRREAEMACLKSGAVHESAALYRIEPINGPGVCGAEFPLKVAALDSGSSYGFADELRPPGGIPTSQQPRWPLRPGGDSAPPAGPTYSSSPPLQSPSSAPAGAPMSINAPGVRPTAGDEIELPPAAGPDGGTAAVGRAPMSRGIDQGIERNEAPLPRLGPSQGSPVTSIGPVTVKPAATLACPIVSALDKWMAETVQPAAMRWFGAPVVEIRQISAYSCRGMNGNPNAHISEHAFGNAIDVAGFTLSDGRRITVKDGWRGMPEEQGFLRDVQGGACQLFNTVLAPGSNVYHYDHIHVDLMRRASGRVICQPGAVSGEQIAARAGARNAWRGQDSGITGSISRSVRSAFAHKPLTRDDEATIEDESRITDSGR
ncbi:extensin family protein [Bradyrhizobium sp. WD16]|uniref:extensin-like domain-containing protein n=1 Tax=Bradyrhizobium sp. WD16 TaxID=1521768 RepID=UPI0020A464CA|nr:extensin family protein [Bradyrhizobium sp. WD16]UTD26004.1 extensin [Bradyrhizobium sp. WD16]